MRDMRKDDGKFEVMGNLDDGLSLGLSKGGMLKERLGLVETAGINVLEDGDKWRKLIFRTRDKQVGILILGACDVARYVENGGGDIGVGGKDVVMEDGGENVYEGVELKIGVCKVMRGGKVGMEGRKGGVKIGRK